MLILARRPGEAIIINNNIKIIYFGNHTSNQGKFGIIAPPEISIHREEIQERINQENTDKLMSS